MNNYSAFIIHQVTLHRYFAAMVRGPLTPEQHQHWQNELNYCREAIAAEQRTAARIQQEHCEIFL